MVENLMMDSGAFSVWNRGRSINVEDYTQFCLEHLDVMDYVVSLDVIPGKPNDKRSLTSAAINRACEGGWDNYQYMLQAGIPKEILLPVYHQNDPIEWLEKFMEEGVPYFGISPANDRTSHQRQLWLDTCMEVVCERDGMPMAKFHGFAVTSLKLMFRYPWFSADSASWLKCAIYGGVMMARGKADGGFDFERTPKVVCVSNKSPKMGDKGAHFKSLDKFSRERFLYYLDMMGVCYGESNYRKEPLDYKHTEGRENPFAKKKDHQVIEEVLLPGVSNSVSCRSLLNKKFFERVQKTMKWPRPFEHLDRRLI
jgi:hypothetical protein